VTGALAALDDDLDMIQQQLEHQMQAQDQNQDDARYGRRPVFNRLASWSLKTLKLFFVLLCMSSGLVQGVGQGTDVSASAHTCSGKEHRWERPAHCWDRRRQGGKTQRASWQRIS